MGHSAGFTLIELMIVVAIVAILTAIAYPSYTRYIIKTHRATATACLAEYANYMERYYTTNLRYDQDATPAATPNTLPDLDCASPERSGARYQYTMPTLTLTASKYVLKATPRGPQAGDACGTLTLDQTGTRGADAAGGGVATCW
jgi:type IV pilus assembly protein PilE